jgi:alkylation response protein AidB-like acyl-CoA dehydrogenase
VTDEVPLIARNTERVGSLLERLRAIEPLIEQHRDAIDRDRCLPGPVVEALVAADLFRLWLPKALGGPELSPLDFMQVVEAAAELDGSVGWIVGNGAGMSRAGGYLPEGVARAWFAEPRAFVVAATGAVGSAIPVTGGYRVTGRWPFGSGIHQATRMMGVCAVAVPEGEPQPPICCYFAPAEVAVIDNWHVSGLRGTGSCDFQVENVFVPVEHTHLLVEHRPTQPGLLYRLPNASVFPLTVSVVPLGIARAAIATFIALAARKSRTGSTVVLRERETIQAEVGRAEALHRAARAYLADAIGGLMAAADEGGEKFLEARAVFRLACSHAADTAVRVTDMMAAAAGSAAIFETCALERCVRDVHAAVKHIAMSPNNYIVGGRVMLGLDPGIARF